ncbi:uncharacterized protein LOC129800562 [Phlebotomus papatasi]|uniref:uncharacterized protein LOC129800562 n=1 Tax=Phlebotomus papatasi TaxID=29031 RepID=UPI0024838674|nr:uncharacterized protein LOC129800562 [Phlebotomus papatasi]
MEMNEISTFNHRRQKIVQKFCLRTSPCGRYYCFMLVDSVVVRKITHSPVIDLPTVNFSVSEMKCPESISSGNIPRDFEAIYNTAEFEEKKSMVLDPLMCVKYVENVLIYLVDLQVSWNLLGRSDALLIGAQNSVGCVKFYSMASMGREWEAVVDVSKEIIELRRSEDGLAKTFSELQNAIQSNIISAFTWTMTPHEVIFKFCVLLKNGVAIFCTYDGAAIGIICERDFNIPNTTKIKWFQFQEHAYLIATVASGEIYLFRVDDDGKSWSLVAVMWTDQDYLIVDHLEVNVNEEEALIFAVKDCFLITFTLSQDEDILCRCDEIGKSAIVGLTHVYAWEYLVVLADRLTKLIQIKKAGDEITFHEVEINSNLPEKYTIFGGVASPHKVFWMFAGELLQPHDIHTWTNSSVIVTISTFSHGNCPLTILTHTESPSLSLDDCKEALRVRWFKENDVNPVYIELVAYPLVNDAESLTNLRKRLIYLGAKCGSLKLGHESESQLFLEEFKYIRTTLIAIGFLRNLQALRNHFKVTRKFTMLQANAVRHFKVGIAEYLTLPMPEEYEPGLQHLRTIFEDSLLGTEDVKCILNCCQVCRKELDENTLNCSEGHEMRRCILTNFQLFIMNETTCSQCDQLILNDRATLTEILLLDPDQEITCPICDNPIIMP